MLNYEGKSGYYNISKYRMLLGIVCNGFKESFRHQFYKRKCKMVNIFELLPVTRKLWFILF